MARGFLRLLDGVNTLACWLAGTLFALATIAVLLQVIVRFVLPAVGVIVAAPWTEESARYLVAWSVFLGVAVLCRHGRLIAVDVFALTLPGAWGRSIRIASIVLSFFFFACLLRTGIDWTVMSMIEASPVMRIPMPWVYAALPVGSALALLNLVGLTIARLTNGGEPVAAAVEMAGD
ncbi:TRAP transporter small permease [Chelatococcus sp. GCM10030263]|uniref:TRAP transporter small permease n=1 Tax=Chelatococcus sp. GCM10030263 TaxID=3273387 RepID=UPI003612E551